MPRIQVALLEVDSTEASRDAGLVGRIRERWPGQGEILRRHGSRFDPGAAGRERDGAREAVGPGEDLQDLRPGPTEAAVPGGILAEGWRGKSGRLIREPRLSVDLLRSLVWPGPGQDLLAEVQIAQSGDGTDGVERSLAVPHTDASIEDGVGESEEELHIQVHPAFVVPVVIPRRYELGEEVPVAGRQLRAGTVRPVLRDHLLLVGEAGADVDQGPGLGSVPIGAVLGRALLGSKLVARRHRKRGHEPPEGTDKPGRHVMAREVDVP